jgi:outer membrane protein OmpA-like peptidoglycan-associated protein
LELELRRLGLEVRGLQDDQLTVDLAEEVPFAVNSAELPDQAQKILGQLAEVLILHSSARVTLIGHTDDRGAADYNRRLSLSRARAVGAYLSAKGVPEERISTQGMGEDAPLAGEGGPNPARQRRVEVIIQPAGG